MQWDASTLTPISNGPDIYNDPLWETDWPASNTSAYVTVTSTLANDGTYPVDSITRPRRLVEEGDLESAIYYYPTVTFSFHGEPVDLFGARTLLPHYVFGLPPDILHPVPFSASAVVYNAGPGVVIDSQQLYTTLMQGSAVAIPEPASASLAAVGLFALAAIRRRLLR